MKQRILQPSPPLGRSQQRGAAIFVVVMVLTLLTAIGVFAARTTSMVDMATGYARQSAQTEGVGVYAVQMGANELAEGRATSIGELMEERTETCPSNRGIANLPCRKVLDNELRARVVSMAPSTALLDEQVAAAPGSLGPMLGASSQARAIEGNIMLEFIEDYQSAPPPGEDARYGAHEFTFNAWAQIRPVTTAANTNWCAANGASTGASIRAIRANVTVPGMM